MNDIHIDEEIYSWDRLPEIGDFVALIDLDKKSVTSLKGDVYWLSGDGHVMKMNGTAFDKNTPLSRTLAGPGQEGFRWGIRAVTKDYREDQPQEDDDDV